MKFSLPAIAIRRPVSVVMLVITIMALGVIAYQRIPIEFLPKMDFPFMFCYIPYPGATPEQVENEIAIPAEGQFRTISQLSRISTTSSSDGCSVQLFFDWNADMAVASAEVRDRMERLQLDLPSGVDRIFLQRWSSDALPVAVYSLSSERDYEEFSHLVRTVLTSRLTRIDGVADVEIFGRPERSVVIEIDQEKLRSRNVSLYQLVSNLQASSVNTTLGEMDEARVQYFVRMVDEFQSPKQISELIIGQGDLRLKEVADVGYDTRDVEGGFSIDGREAVVLMIRKESEANTVDVCEAISEAMDRLPQDPVFADVKRFEIFSQAEVITSALDALLKAGQYGGLLALVVLFLFLQRVRPTVLVALAIPTSVVMAFVFMFFTSISLNLITMISMIVALGMLVDNSIVVIENIYRYNQIGLSPEECARRGASEVGLAITAATMTTLVVFIPVLYLDSGPMATYMRQFGAPITVSLLGSLVVALTVIPLAASHMKELNPRTRRHPLRRFGQHAMLRMAGPKAYRRIARHHPLATLINGYSRFLGLTLRWRLASVIVLLAIIVVTVAVPARRMKRADMPEQDRRQVTLSLEFDANVDTERAEDIVQSLEQRIEERREDLGVVHLLANWGRDGGSIDLFLTQKEDLPPGEEYKYSTDEVADILRQIPTRLPGAELEVRVSHGEQQTGGGRQLTVMMRGEDSATLRSYADNLMDQMRAYVPGVTEITTGFLRADEELQLSIDETLAANAGVSPMMIAQTVDFALRGARLPYLKREGREIPVWIQFAEEDRRTLANLENVAIQTEQSGLVPINRLVDIGKGTTPRAIQRVNGKNVLSVTAQIDTDDYGATINRLKTVIANFDMPRGYDVELGQNIQQFETDTSNFVTALLLSCVLIYLVMGALFESFLLPLSILWSVPMAFIGVAWMMYLSDTPFDSVAMIGAILMTGIVVNNGIVIIDHINQLRANGLDRYTAIVQAGRDRFRPVMMTALTTILGCVPIAFAGAVGSDVAFSSLGRALIGGLTSGAVLTLVVVPLMYTFIDDLRHWLAGFVGDLLFFGRRPA